MYHRRQSRLILPNAVKMGGDTAVSVLTFMSYFERRALALWPSFVNPSEGEAHVVPIRNAPLQMYPLLLLPLLSAIP